VQRSSRRILRGLVAVAAGLVLFGGAGTRAEAQPGPTPPGPAVPSQGTVVPNEVLVQFRPTTPEPQKADARGRARATLQERLRTLGPGDLELLTIPPGLLVADAVRALQSHPAVQFAEPNWLYEHQATATDSYYANGSLWGLKGGFGSNAAAAWAAGATGSAAVYVGVIDEGIQFDHPDLAGQIWTNPYDAAGDGVDNDANGYVDDVHGWDFDGGDNTIYDGGARGGLDDHGTHVAGTIGAKANNGSGVVGVNWNVTLISAKFLGRRGGTTANAVKAVDYFTDLKTRHGLDIVATNNSWGGGGYSQALFDAIERAKAADILFIAAAGNGDRFGRGLNNDTTPHYPASYANANIIAVAAIDSGGAKASFSNYGATSVDLGAPGVSVWSTTAYNGYSSYNGTSMATPHVTGAVALYAATHPGTTAAQIKSAILTSAVPTPALAGQTPVATGGRLEAFAALSK